MSSFKSSRDIQKKDKKDKKIAYRVKICSRFPGVLLPARQKQDCRDKLLSMASKDYLNYSGFWHPLNPKIESYFISFHLDCLSDE